MQRAFKELPRYVRMALQVCDSAVADLLADEPVVSGLVTQVGARFGRVQLDFAEGECKIDHARLRAFMLNRHGIEFITLHNEKNAALTASLAGVPNHSILFDASFGRGVRPDAWPKAIATKRCGYAGGLGVDSLEKELPRIYAAADQVEFWISLGDRLRDNNDRFDIHAARHCLELVGFELSHRTEMPKQHPRRRQCELIDLFDAGLTHESESALDFEMMLQHMVHASQDSLDPNLMEVRRKAEGLLLRKGNALPTYAQARAPTGAH
jgi:hypothetical protein